MNMSELKHALHVHLQPEGEQMSTHEVQRQPAVQAPQPPKSDLITNYHRIGISAVNAALACRPKRQEEEQHCLKEPREES